MSKPTVKRRDIELYEEAPEVELSYTDLYPKPTENVWVAELRGRLSTGPCVQLSRQADHAGEALLRLEEAIRAQGWEIEVGNGTTLPVFATSKPTLEYAVYRVVEEAEGWNSFSVIWLDD